MRILFLSGTSVGGAARSTHELAAVLAARGHDVATLMRRDEATRLTYLHRRAVNLREKVGGGPAAGVVDALTRRIGARMAPDRSARPYRAYTAVRPENALRAALRSFAADAVVVNSIDLPAWRQVRADLRAAGIPVVLYLREETGLLHLSHSRLEPDLLLANAEGHAVAARALGHDAVVVPSIVDCSRCRTEPARTHVLFVNPVPEQGLDIALALAAARPDIPFAFAESWPLDAAQLTALGDEAARLGNVELRRFDPDATALFRDARVLLAPYRYPGRSRVVAEAQCNGIPVLGSDRYGVAEATGAGGVLVDPDGPLAAWVDALAAMWDDAEAYDAWGQAARRHAARPEMDPGHVAATFEQAVAPLLRRPRVAAPGPSGTATP